MRLAFGRKLYRCHACEALMLLKPQDVRLRLDAENPSSHSVPDDMFPETVANHHRA